MTLCECGCGQVVTPGKKFIRWHHTRCPSDETRRRMSETHTGYKHSEKTKQKISESNKGGGIIKTHQTMYENKDCSAYLGIVIGERLCKHLFKDVKIMPHDNKGFDMICNKGMKIDIKTACRPEKRLRWQFTINKNKIADYFILVAFDNRIDLNLQHMWMIPGDEINTRDIISIAPSTIHRWSQWEKNINDAQLCCTAMKSDNHYVHLKEK